MKPNLKNLPVCISHQSWEKPYHINFNRWNIKLTLFLYTYNFLHLKIKEIISKSPQASASKQGMQWHHCKRTVQKLMQQNHHSCTRLILWLLSFCKTAKTVDARTTDLSLSFTSLLNKQEKRERETNVIDNLTSMGDLKMYLTWGLALLR